MATEFSRALIVGASSGMGAELAKRLAADGARVALVARRREALAEVAAAVDNAAGERRAFVYVHDVRSPAEAGPLLEQIARDLGGLDLVVWAAGLTHRLGWDDWDGEREQELIAINLAGAVAWLGPVAERFARLGRGTIVGVGSVAGDRGRGANPVYCAAKAGLHTYLEGLRNRVARHGVTVVTIKPGFVATAQTEGLPGLFWLIGADRAAELILEAARRRVVQAYVPGRWRLLMAVIRRIPSFLFRRLKV